MKKYEVTTGVQGKELGISQKNIDVTREHYMKKKKLTEMRNTLLQIRTLAGL
ncbi:hypothetical protein [uncultured Fusobacterium sp.]|uniref:hypothetical protein n=1 Tax=uncultured Fusobacterium sp. TaxID=159267 RepID=UPI0025FED13A|nr:hypothetical protein [uncultured Fusobacterium sp.]